MVDKLWIYDPDLNQVVVKKLDQALGATPAALLAGDDYAGDKLRADDGGKSGDLEFVDARTACRRQRLRPASGSD